MTSNAAVPKMNALRRTSTPEGGPITLEHLMRYLMLLSTLLCFACSNPPAPTPKQSKPAPKAKAPLIDGHYTKDEYHQLAQLTLKPAPLQDTTNRYANDPRAAHFGQFLFYETRLSANNKVSCASCHQPDHGFSTTERHATGIHKTKRHPPTLVNIAYSPWFDWDGKANTLWGQAMRPLESPDEHGLTRVSLAQIIAKNQDLKQAYEAIFGSLPSAILNTKRFNPDAMPTPQTPNAPTHKAWMAMAEDDRETINRIAANITKAIAAYQHKIVDFNAPFDRYGRALIKGDAAASKMIPASAKRGFKLFVGKALCVNCHSGPTYSDHTFHNLGLAPPSTYVKNDLGRSDGIDLVKHHEFNASGPYSDDRKGTRAQWLSYMVRTRENKGQFKTPTLRNVAVTFPYMHGGHFEGIRRVIEFYNELRDEVEVGHREEMLQPIGLSDPEIDDMIAFLRTLTSDQLDPTLLKKPASALPGQKSTQTKK